MGQHLLGHERDRRELVSDRTRLSLDLIRGVAPGDRGRIIDVGGGASLLVDWLLDLPFEKIAVLDVSETALCKSRARLGERAASVDWIAADITEAPTLGKFDVWHDRAVFHFLTDPEDRKKYVELAGRTVRSGGHLVIATFAEDGPKRCSELDVCRYNGDVDVIGAWRRFLSRQTGLGDAQDSLGPLTSVFLRGVPAAMSGTIALGYGAASQMAYRLPARWPLGMIRGSRERERRRLGSVTAVTGNRHRYSTPVDLKMHRNTRNTMSRLMS